MIMKSFFQSLLLASLVTGAAGWAVHSKIEGMSLDASKLQIVVQPTVIYDKNGNPIAQFFDDERKTPTTYNEIPQEIIDGVVSTEDRDFFTHPGINVKGIARALFTDLKSKSFAEGGSTLTQQLIKTVYLNSGKTVTRKEDEAIYATMLEQQYSKQDILASYLDHIFYGSHSYGVEDAVQTYFGESLNQFKKEDRITKITKAAFIAGIPQSPTEYAPYTFDANTNQWVAKTGAALAPMMNRRNLVLRNMLNEGYITQDEYNQAVKKPLLVLPQPNVVRKDEQIVYKDYVKYVLQEAQADLQYNSIDEVMHSGLKIYTSFDPYVNSVVTDKFRQGKYYPPNSSNDGTHVEGAGVFLNPNNGEILSLVGGREGPQNFLDLNRSTEMLRQPGSSIKPLIDYGPALESGKFNMYSSLLDEAGHDFGGGYRPHDWDGSGRGSVSMSEALRESWNIPAIWTLQQVGIPYAKQYIKKLGINLDSDKSGLPMAIGGLDQGVSPLQMADAYQAYANGGYRVPAHAIRRVVTYSGDVLFEPKTEPVKVISDSTYEQMRYMLRNVVRWGTGTGANVPGQMVSGKTGTVEYPGVDSWYKDIWFAGVTKDYVGVVWMGYDNTDSKHHLTQESAYPAKLFGSIIAPLLQQNPDPESNYQTPSITQYRKSDFNLQTNSVSEESQKIQPADLTKYNSTDEQFAADKKAEEDKKNQNSNSQTTSPPNTSTTNLSPIPTSPTSTPDNSSTGNSSTGNSSTGNSSTGNSSTGQQNQNGSTSTGTPPPTTGNSSGSGPATTTSNPATTTSNPTTNPPEPTSPDKKN